MGIKTVAWTGRTMRCVDQTKLPERLVYIECRTPAAVWHALRRLAVRGAPAIGIAAAMGVVLGARRSRARSCEGFVKDVRRVARYLGSARPTAVNLFWALRRMVRVVETAATRNVRMLTRALEREAVCMIEEDNAVCRRIGIAGVRLLRVGDSVLTHCNAGGLATAEHGTALAVIFEAHARGKNIHVFVDETRPLLQGARLTAWELMRAGIHATLICDNMAARVMCEGRVDIVITGADRIAANGDTANKIGTYGLACLAAAHRVPFYIAAPLSTVDLQIASGADIPIEQRDPDEVRRIGSRWIAPRNVPVYNPAFDVTPARLIRGIITEEGIVRPPYRRNLATAVGKSTAAQGGCSL
ncbi:MAG: S-methyl-5-thioribose-1-phosphate isomerase [Candidatus Aureabacteria bacterium]|nr:S-methyl-5-thioribose-1-phosphate isomerase [Candidatus Auribacterota bacterium]